MIPRTFPSIIEALQTKMVVYVLPSITGLTAWIDYIPVKGVTTESNALANTYALDGYQVVKTIESLTGKQAWLDYIPVFESASYNKPWSTDAGGYIPAGGLFSVASLFAAGEQGTWYDPSDFTTLFQDSAGTTPVTAVQQPVGLMLDKSKGLVLGANVWPSTFDAVGANWTNLGGGAYSSNGGAGDLFKLNALQANKTYSYTITVTSYVSGILNAPYDGSGSNIRTIASAGTFTGVFRAIYGTTNLGIYSVSFNGTISSVTVRELPGNHAFQTTSASRPVLSARYNLLTATTTLATQSVTTRATTQTLSFTGAGSIVLSGTATGTYTAGTHSVVTTAGTLTLTVSGTVTDADLRASNDSFDQPAYQRVNTATDYDTVGFKPYLAFDGVDDSLVTNSIDFTSTDKMTVFAGVRKLSDAIEIVAEFSSSVDLNSGSFHVVNVSGTPSQWQFVSKGTILASVRNTGNNAPITNVITGIGDISGDQATIRVNGTQAATNTDNQGTGNYGNYPLYIGRKGTATLPFNGRIYSLIVRGAASTTAQITSTETYVNQKTGAY